MFSQSAYLLMRLSLTTLTFVIRTSYSILVEQIGLVNSVLVFVSQMTLLRWLTFLLGSLTVTHHSVLLDFFLFPDASVCSTGAFPAFGNSDHASVSVFIDFSSNSKLDAQFHCITYDYSCYDWDSLHDHLRDVLWEDILKCSASASEFCEWV